MNVAVRVALYVLLVFLFTGAAPAATITSSDAGKVIHVDFDGNVEGNDVPGLAAGADFTVDVFTSNMVHFTISLTNYSKLGIFSRVSALGFDLTDAMLLNANVSGLFSTPGYVLGGQFPNKFGDIDICFTNGNTCQGGGNGGVSTGQTGTIAATLNFKNDVDALTIQNFGVRYQSIIGTPYGTSGTGQGTVPSVPEPGTAALAFTGLGLMVTGLWRRRRRRAE